MKGIDVSSNNGSIDFNQVKALGVEVVYIKATQGTSYINPYLAEQYEGAEANGFKIGFYHYLGHNNPALEAQHFLSATDGLTADCKYVIDVEGEWTMSEASVATSEFADYLISQGKEVCIYTGDYFYRDNLDSTVKDLPLWVANYGGTILANCYVGLQYSDKGQLSGINGNVDLNEFDAGILISQTKTIEIEEVKKVRNLVVVGNAVDKRAGEYLADALQCPVIEASLPFDYSAVENVYGVGGTPSTNGIVGWTSYAKTIIVGSDRYDTAQKVLDFIKAGGK